MITTLPELNPHDPITVSVASAVPALSFNRSDLANTVTVTQNSAGQLTFNCNLASAGIVSSNVGIFKSPFFLTVPTLNTWVSTGLFAAGFTGGIIIIRDQTNGGCAIFMGDSNAFMQVSNNTISPIAAQWSGGDFQVRFTAGSGPHLVQITCLGM